MNRYCARYNWEVQQPNEFFHEYPDRGVYSCVSSAFESAATPTFFLLLFYFFTFFLHSIENVKKHQQYCWNIKILSHWSTSCLLFLLLFFCIFFFVCSVVTIHSSMFVAGKNIHFKE